jgi:predicted ferric reductase
MVVPRESNLTQFCLPDAFHVPDALAGQVNITHCQSCQAGQKWRYSDWMFTSQPGIFGLVGGYANPTGVALIIILTVMVICSMSFVRRSGYFLVFYFSHLNYIFYLGILLVHAPEFWKWFIVFGCIWLVEVTYRIVSTFLGHGKSIVDEGISLPSRVTFLKIKKPPKFNYSPGDWCFIKIPKIATFEWHPFTISSAPEDQNHFSVHVRGVGQWTNKLYDHFKHKNDMKSRMIAGGDKFGQNKDLELSGMNFNIERPLEIFVDGPFGSPSSNIFRAEHAILVGTGVGVTPFASILQSIVHRYRQVKKECPNCDHKWSDDVSTVMNNLKKVDFFWINRDQKSFEWFVSLLTQLEMEQAEQGGALGRFLEMHMYVTSALQKTDMKSVFLQLAMDLNFKKEQRDLVTGLKSRTNAGRPNWNKIFAKVKEQRKGKVTVFFCGNPTLGRVLNQKCNDFGFTFRKEVF